MFKISVIIPVFNRRSVLTDTIRSVLEQTYQPYEIIVVDDGSTDGTGEFLALTFPNILLITLPVNSGPAYARNVGLSHSKGNVIAFLDSDDIWFSDYLFSQSTFLSGNPTVDLVFSAHINMLENGDRVFVRQSWPPRYPQVNMLMSKNFIHTMSIVMIKRDALLDVGLLREDLYICHDREFYIRFLENHKVGYNDSYLVHRRFSNDQLTKNLSRWFSEAKVVLNIFFSNDEIKDLRFRYLAHIELHKFFSKRISPKNISVLKLRCLICLNYYRLLLLISDNINPLFTLNK